MQQRNGRGSSSSGPSLLTAEQAQQALAEVSSASAAVAGKAGFPTWDLVLLSVTAFVAASNVWPTQAFSVVLIVFLTAALGASMWLEYKRGLTAALPSGRTGGWVYGVAAIAAVGLLVFNIWAFMSGKPTVLGAFASAALGLIIVATLLFRQQQVKRYRLAGPLPSTVRATPQLDASFAAPSKTRIAGVLASVQVIELETLVSLLPAGTTGVSEDLDSLSTAGYAAVFWRKTPFTKSRRLWVRFTPAGRKAFKGHVAALRAVDPAQG